MPYYLEGSELSQFNAIVDCFQRCISSPLNLEAIPDQFRTEDVEIGYLGTTWLFSSRKKRILYIYNENCFYINFWKFPPATLIPTKNAINTICAYQTCRYQRNLGRGHLLDPTNLVCEQLKHWLLQLAQRNLTESIIIKREISSYVEYIKAIEKNNIFPASKAGIHYTATMNGTLIEVSLSLQRTVDEIENLAQRRSLREVISNITKYTESTVDSGLQYLFYILRSNKSPSAINIRSVSQNDNYLIDSIKNTRSYKLLKLLLCSPYVRQVNRMHPVDASCENILSNNLDNLSIKKQKTNTPASDSKSMRQNSYLNRSIGGNLIPDRNLLRRWWSNVHSGIDLYFQEDLSLLNDFVKLHGIIERLSYFTIICHHMEELVDFFGMVIWAEMGTKILDHFQEVFRRLNLRFRQCVQHIHSTAKFHYDDLIHKNKNSHWRHNYNNADRLFDAMLRDMELALSHVSSIPKVIDRYRHGSYDQQTRERVSGVIRNLNHFGILFEMQPIEPPPSQQAEPARLDYHA